MTDKDPLFPQTGAEGEPLLAALARAPHEWALFLDIDGTLLDLAETPDGIVVPPRLPDVLQALTRHLGGALALVTGRQVALADRLFTPHRFPIAGLHGAERRGSDGTLIPADRPPALDDIRAELARAPAALPGVLFEDKGAALALHYRQAQGTRDRVAALMEKQLARIGEGWELLHGKMVVELRPAAKDKGRALRAFLDSEPFAGRKPLAIGDDVTDEAMFAAANALGGTSIRIAPPDQDTAALATLPTPERLRQILEEIAHER
ncbi:trehalose-phosphatase [Plastorhodobacter daqingensis]|uniref:Trehalose 6-phosphate phosphatase n=1 Tax=Plastorhodobacter daqingensis TaxID=1387281 RepID=A0ABW2UIZ6_9RHOB